MAAPERPSDAATLPCSAYFVPLVKQVSSKVTHRVYPRAEFSALIQYIQSAVPTSLILPLPSSICSRISTLFNVGLPFPLGSQNHQQAKMTSRFETQTAERKGLPLKETGKTAGGTHVKESSSAQSWTCHVYVVIS